MIWPFVIFTLPRSRSTWLSQFLSYGGLQVGHDLAPRADTVQGFFDKLWPLAGTVETGAVEAHALLRKAMPDAKFVVVHRPVAEVRESLFRFGISEPDLERRAEALRQIDGCHIGYDQLRDVRICAAMWEYLYPFAFDFGWWRHMDGQNVQVDVAAEVAMQFERREQIAALRAEAVSCDTVLRVWWEAFDSFWADPDCAPLCEAHYREADNVSRFEPDVALLQQLEASGVFRVMTARLNGKLIGYLMWSLTVNAESIGQRIADQGAWYVAPGAPAGIAAKMLRRSITELRAAGIGSIHLHHPVQGRGARLGTLFQRIGARPTQHRWSLELSR